MAQKRCDCDAHGGGPAYSAPFAPDHTRSALRDTGGSLQPTGWPHLRARVRLVQKPIEGAGAGTLEEEVQTDTLATYAHKLDTARRDH